MQLLQQLIKLKCLKRFQISKKLINLKVSTEEIFQVMLPKHSVELEAFKMQHR
jgi:hypothetical protein